DEALPLASARLDDAGLEFVAARVERLDPLGHRIAYGHDAVDREHHGRGGYAGKHRAGEDDVDSQQRRSGWRVDHDVRSVPAQISKLTILAMMKAPMLIHTRPPRPVAISRSSTKKSPR